MPPNPCPCCGHDNPADATFCCACGVQVTLLPCPSCGAVNDNVATNCYQCERPLPGRAKELPDTVPPAARGSGPASRSTSRAVASALVLATMGALAYYAYTQFSTLPLPRHQRPAVRRKFEVVPQQRVPLAEKRPAMAPRSRWTNPFRRSPLRPFCPYLRLPSPCLPRQARRVRVVTPRNPGRRSRFRGRHARRRQQPSGYVP